MPLCPRLEANCEDQAGLARRNRLNIVLGLSTAAEIEAAIEKLPVEERLRLIERLNRRFLENPGMLAALDEGILSLEAEQVVPLEEVRRKIAGWITK